MAEPLTINHIRSAMEVAKGNRLKPLNINGREVYTIFADEAKVRRIRFLHNLYRFIGRWRGKFPVVVNVS